MGPMDDTSSRPSTQPTTLRPAEPQELESDGAVPKEQIIPQLELGEQQLALCPQLRRVRSHPAHQEGSAGMQLVIALKELRTVSNILRGCGMFWTHMDDTVQELARIRDHTQTLLKYAARNPRLKAR